MKFKWKIALCLNALLLPVIVLIGIIVDINLTNIVSRKTQTELINYSELGITLLDTNYPGDWRIDGDKLYKGNTLMNQNYDVVDRISKNTGLMATLFAGNTRVSTTVTDKKGNRVIGTKASDAVTNVVLTKGLPYNGTAQVVGKSAVAYYVPLKDTNGKTIGMLFVGIYKSAIAKDYESSLQWIFILLITVIIVCIIASYFIGVYITKGYRVISYDLLRLENGDFNVIINNKSLKRKDEIGDITRSFQNMQQKIREIVTSIKTEANHIGTSSVALAEGANNINHDIENISATTQELSAGMEETAASTQEMSAASLSIEEEIGRVTNKTKSGYEIAIEIKGRAEGLKKVALESQQTAAQMYESANKKLRQSIEKAAAINEIKSLSQTILNITAQTNLLALNASIESARAGEAGKGFAVVAAEIANLAQNSKSAVSKIETISNDISVTVEDIVGDSKQLLNFMDSKVIKDYELLVDTGEQYNTDAATVEQMVTEIKNSADQLLESISYIRKAVDEITAASQEGAKGSSEIAEKSTSIYQKTNEVLKQANKNKEITSSLNELVKFFQINQMK